MAQDVRQLVGGNVRRVREAAGLTQAELAARLEVDRAYISGLELGARNATIMTLWLVAQALQVAVSELFAGAEAPSAQRQRKRGH